MIFEKAFERMMGAVSGKPVEVKSVDDQPTDEKELISFVRKRVDESRSNANRVAHEGIWMTNIAYLMGFDSLYYNTQTRSYAPLNGAAQFISKNRIRENVLLPMVQNRLARLCKIPPRFDTLPNSPSEDDKEASLLSLDILTDIWQRQEINRKRIPLMMWTQQCGHSYLKVSWDKNAGDKMPDVETGQLMPAGAVRVDVVSAFEVFPDPLAKELTEDECAWVIHAKIRTIDYFKSHYDRGELVKPEMPWLLSLQYEARVNSVNVMGPGATGDLTLTAKNTAIELSYYERPSEKHKKGRHIITANGVLLKDDALPVDMYPFAKFDDIVVGGKYYSECCTTHALPLQDQYNRVLSKRKEWTDKLLAGKYKAARMHGLMKEALNDRSGEVLEYDPVPNQPPPEKVDVPTIPEYAYRETDELKNGIASIYGLSEVSRGIVQPSMPAIGMQLIVEQDETRIGIEVEQHEHAFARTGTLILKYEEEFAKGKRSIRKRDSQGNYSFKEYTGADIKGNTACLVIRGSTVPTSKAMRRQEIDNAYTKGFLGDPADPIVRMQTMQKMEYGDTSGMWKKLHSDMQQIKKVISDIENGVILLEETPLPDGRMSVELQPPVSKYDNHALFIQEMNEYRKSDKYDDLDIDKKEVFERVMDDHTTWAAKLSNPSVSVPPAPPMNLEGIMANEEEALESEVAPIENNLDTEQNMTEGAQAI